jgi:hypothetical protein
VLTRPRQGSTIKINSKISLYSYSHFTKHLIGAFRKSSQKNNLNQESSSLLIRWLENDTEDTCKNRQSPEKQNGSGHGFKREEQIAQAPSASTWEKKSKQILLPHAEDRLHPSRLQSSMKTSGQEKILDRANPLGALCRENRPASWLNRQKYQRQVAGAHMRRKISPAAQVWPVCTPWRWRNSALGKAAGKQKSVWQNSSSKH